MSRPKESESESRENRNRRGKEWNTERREGKYHTIISSILGKIGHRIVENWIWGRFLRSREKPQCIKCENNGRYQNGRKQMQAPADK